MIQQEILPESGILSTKDHEFIDTVVRTQVWQKKIPNTEEAKYQLKMKLYNDALEDAKKRKKKSLLETVKIAQKLVGISTSKIAKKRKEPKKPKKVTEIADAIRRDNSKISDEAAYRMAWESYCSYINPKYEGCTSKGKSKRKSPKKDRVK